MSNLKNTDVCIHVYGKPYQTIVALKTLLIHSGKHIRNIYFVEECVQPEDYCFNLISSKLAINLEKSDVALHRLNPTDYIGTYEKHTPQDMREYENNPNNQRLRKCLRYQLGLENCTEKYAITTHNDMVYHSDIIAKFLENINNCFCIGQIGQCWNCPIGLEKKCGHDQLESMLANPISAQQIKESIEKHQYTRTYKYFKNRPTVIPSFPMPECRVNEWCCMIDMEYYRKEVIPNGTVYPLGYAEIDTGDRWFKEMVEKGYTFRNLDIADYATHSYFNPYKTGNGRSSIYNETKYTLEEEAAKKYIKKLENLERYL
jgi:hypothetical protein